MYRGRKLRYRFIRVVRAYQITEKATVRRMVEKAKRQAHERELRAPAHVPAAEPEQPASSAARINNVADTQQPEECASHPDAPVGSTTTPPHEAYDDRVESPLVLDSPLSLENLGSPQPPRLHLSTSHLAAHNGHRSWAPSTFARPVVSPASTCTPRAKVSSAHSRSGAVAAPRYSANAVERAWDVKNVETALPWLVLWSRADVLRRVGVFDVCWDEGTRRVFEFNRVNCSGSWGHNEAMLDESAVMRGRAHDRDVAWGRDTMLVGDVK